MPLPTRRTCTIAAALSLLAGLGSALAIYLAATDEPDAGMVDEYLRSKRYHHERLVYGGQLTVLADDLGRWFASLWHGKRLAGTVAGIGVAGSLGLAALGRAAGKKS